MISCFCFGRINYGSIVQSFLGGLLYCTLGQIVDSVSFEKVQNRFIMWEKTKKGMDECIFWQLVCFCKNKNAGEVHKVKKKVVEETNSRMFEMEGVQNRYNTWKSSGSIFIHYYTKKLCQ